MLKQAVFLATLLVHGLALPAQEARVFETSTAPPAWRRLRPASDDAMVHLQIGITHEENTIKQLELRLFEGIIAL